MRPVHAQPSARITDEQRAPSDRSANLCRNRPAVWSATVRYCDEMVRSGVSLDEARGQALELYAPEGEQQKLPRIWRLVRRGRKCSLCRTGTAPPCSPSAHEAGQDANRRGDRRR